MNNKFFRVNEYISLQKQWSNTYFFRANKVVQTATYITEDSITDINEISNLNVEDTPNITSPFMLGSKVQASSDPLTGTSLKWCNNLRKADSAIVTGWNNRCEYIKLSDDDAEFILDSTRAIGKKFDMYNLIKGGVYITLWDFLYFLNSVQEQLTINGTTFDMSMYMNAKGVIPKTYDDNINKSEYTFYDRVICGYSIGDIGSDIIKELEDKPVYTMSAASFLLHMYNKKECIIDDQLFMNTMFDLYCTKECAEADIKKSALIGMLTESDLRYNIQYVAVLIGAETYLKSVFTENKKVASYKKYMTFYNYSCFFKGLLDKAGCTYKAKAMYRDILLQYSMNDKIPSYFK